MAGPRISPRLIAVQPESGVGRVALQGWKTSFCGSSGGTQVLTHGSSGLWTRVEFAGGHFQNLTIGKPNADPCL